MRYDWGGRVGIKWFWENWENLHCVLDVRWYHEFFTVLGVRKELQLLGEFPHSRRC